MKEKPFIVSLLRFDSETDARIQTMMSRIRHSIGITESSDSFPHVSLIPTALEDRDGVIARLSERFASHPAIEIVFSHIGYFPGGVLFLGVTPTEALITLHQQVYSASAPGPQTPWIDLYRPGRWIPHCTVAMEMPNESLERAVKEACECVAFPLVGTCVSIELLEVRPGQPLRTLRTIDLMAS